MKLSEIKPKDVLTVFDKPSRNIRERQGKYVSGNADFLTIQFLYYKDSLSLSDLILGKATLFKDKEAVTLLWFHRQRECLQIDRLWVTTILGVKSYKWFEII